jgi:hypothetical protein
MDTEREGAAATFRQYTDWGRRQFNEGLEEYPFPAVLIAFGLGVGLGLAVGGALADAMSPPRESLTERLGRQVLDALSSALPEPLSKRLRG